MQRSVSPVIAIVVVVIVIAVAVFAYLHFTGEPDRVEPAEGGAGTGRAPEGGRQPAEGAERGGRRGGRGGGGDRRGGGGRGGGRSAPGSATDTEPGGPE
jgi:hypothetical protein